MANTRNWSGLSEAQRKRYVAAGRTGTLTGKKGLTPSQVQKYYERGGDLSAGRGHREDVARKVRKPALRSAVGAETDADRKALERFRRSTTFPTWLPRNKNVMQDSTAAALALIGTPPRNWKNVQITRNEDTGGYSVLVTTKRGRKVATELQNREALSQFSQLLRNPTAMGRTNAERATLRRQWTRANGQQWEIDVEMPPDTDPISMAPINSNPRSMPTTGKAIPKKKRE